MEPAQFYETTVFDRSSRYALSAVTVPSRSFEVSSQGVEMIDPLQVVDSIGFDKRTFVPIVERHELRDVLSSLLAERPYSPFRSPDFVRGGLRRDRPELREFVGYAIEAPLVPVESSPLSGQSAFSLLGSGSGIAAAYTTGHPVLILIVPGGIVLLGAAKGIAEAMQIGLRARLLELMGVEDPQTRRRRSPET
jgi:hypothetical protein